MKCDIWVCEQRLDKVDSEHVGKRIHVKGNNQWKMCRFKEHLGDQMSEISVEERRYEIKLGCLGGLVG